MLFNTQISKKKKISTSHKNSCWSDKNEYLNILISSLSSLLKIYISVFEVFTNLYTKFHMYLNINSITDRTSLNRLH